MFYNHWYLLLGMFAIRSPTSVPSRVLDSSPDDSATSVVWSNRQPRLRSQVRPEPWLPPAASPALANKIQNTAAWWAAAVGCHQNRNILLSNQILSNECQSSEQCEMAVSAFAIICSRPGNWCWRVVADGCSSLLPGPGETCSWLWLCSAPMWRIVDMTDWLYPHCLSPAAHNMSIDLYVTLQVLVLILYCVLSLLFITQHQQDIAQSSLYPHNQRKGSSQSHTTNKHSPQLSFSRQGELGVTTGHADLDNITVGFYENSPIIFIPSL